MQKKLRSFFMIYWETAKRRVKAQLRAQRYKTVRAISALLADFIINAAIVVGILSVIFLTSITLSFSLAMIFKSHVLGFLGSTLCLTLAALLVLWQRPRVERYFEGLTIARYFEKLKEKR